MEKDDLKDLFQELEGQFDIAEPDQGHQARFLGKLNKQVAVHEPSGKVRNLWRPLAIAASLALLVTLGYNLVRPNVTVKEQVAEISPEASETETYFVSLINEQVQQLEMERSPETARMIDGALKQLERLQNDHKTLEQELLDGGPSEIILKAMIRNFQTRIDLLQEVLDNVKTINELKPIEDESFSV